MARRGLVMLGALASGLAAAVMVAGPAAAYSPSSATAGKPTWSSGVLKSGTSTFKTSSYGTDSYVVYTYLVRKSTSSPPSCSPYYGCDNSSSQALLRGPVAEWFSSLPKSSTYSISPVSYNCPTTSSYRYYWTYIRVVGLSGGNPVGSLSSSLYGRYC